MKRMREKIWIFIGLVILLVLYEAVGIFISYGRHPEVSDAYKQSFQTEKFYGKEESSERAVIIEDNKEALEHRLRLIEEAEQEIILSTFDFKSDESGKDVQAALLHAAQRGVQVRIIVDGFSAITHMRDDYFSALSSSDHVEFRAYNLPNPLLPWKTMGRMHDKYLMIDHKFYMLGGRNTYDYFLGGKGYQNYDRDVLVYEMEPENKNTSIYELYQYFEKVWQQKECVRFRDQDGERKEVRKAKKELEERYQGFCKRYPKLEEAYSYEDITYPVNQISILVNPSHVYGKKPEIFYSLIQLMERARSEVRIHTPYVICNSYMYDGFRQICNGTAKVSMMTNSVANNGNPFGASDYAIHKEELIQTGIQIYEYEGGVSYHGKSVTIDDDLAIVGSFNMDMRSAYLDTEIMLVVHSREVTAQLNDYMDSYEEQAGKVLDKYRVEMPEGMERQKISPKREKRVRLLKAFNWLRFLM